MEPFNNRPDDKGHTRVFGIPRDYRERQHRPLEVTGDTTAWDIYNHQAGMIERERVKDWNDTLNTLLIFAALYSGVLTAFIIESMQLMQQDSSDVTLDVLLVITKQLANNSTPAFELTTFVAPEWAIRVNYCFFASLSCALVTALAAVLALQWVSSYDRGLNPSSAEGRALQRHFRSQGAKEWKLEHIITSLPTVIFISLLIFFVGVADWLWHIHHGVAAVVITGIICGISFYVSTTAISMTYLSAPFRTPVTRTLPLFMGEAVRHLTNLINHITSTHTFNSDISPQSFKKRERDAVESKKDLRRDSLFWLARSISIGPYQRSNLLIIVQEILQLPPWKLVNDHTHSAPWRSIFTVLYEPYRGKREINDSLPEDLTGAVLFMKALSSIGQGFFTTAEFADLVQSFYGGYSDLQGMCRILDSWRNLEMGSVREIEPEVEQKIVELEGEEEKGESIQSRGTHRSLRQKSPNSLRLTVVESYQYVVQSWRQCPPEFIILTLQDIKADHSRLSVLTTSELFTPISQHLQVDFINSTVTDIMPFQILDLILEIIAARLSNPPIPAFSLESYLASVERHCQETPDEQAIQAHGVLMRQIVAVLSQIHEGNMRYGSLGYDILPKILQLVKSILWNDLKQTMTAALLRSLAKTGIDIWNERNRACTAKIISSILRTQWEFTGDNWVGWWVEIMLGFAAIAEREPDILEIIVKHGRRLLSAKLPGRSGFTADQITKLSEIREPGVLLLASVVTRSPELAESLSEMPSNWALNAPWNGFIEFCYRYLGENASLLDMHFLRAFTVLGSLELSDRLYEDHVRHIMKSPSKLFEYLRYPVLPAVFKFANDRKQRNLQILETVAKHDRFIGEFIRADGLTWLPSFVSSDARYLEEALRIIRKALVVTKVNKHANSWVTCARDCLIETGKAVHDGRVSLWSVQSYARKDAALLSDELQKRKSRWLHKNGGDGHNELEVPRSQLNTPEGVPDSSPILPVIVTADMKDDDSTHHDNEGWTEEEWKAWQSLLDEVIAGLVYCHIEVKEKTDQDGTT